MLIKYTGLSMNGLRDGMIVNVPTNWETAILGNVIDYACDEISDALHRRGIYLSKREMSLVFSTFSSGHDAFYNFWTEA
jgi:hypothetical protein